MDVSTYVTRLREDLVAAAAAGDEQTRRTAALLAAAVEPAARLAVMNALSDLAAEVTAALDDRVVELRLDGRDVRVVVSPDAHAPAGDTPSDTGPAQESSRPADAPGWAGPFGGGPGQQPFKGFGDGGDISRITLRLVEQIKGQAEQAAAAQGMSLNSWVAQAVQGALAAAQGRHDPRHGPHDPRRGDDGRRLRGWVQG